MGKKKKQNEDIDSEEDLFNLDNLENEEDELDKPIDESQSLDEDYNIEKDKSFNGIDFDDSVVNNSLQFASMISKPSDTADKFQHVPKEVRYSFYDDIEKKDIKHWAATYHRYNYLKKILALQAREDEIVIANRLTLYEIENEKDFEEYCKENNILICFQEIKNANPELMNQVLTYIKNLKRSGYYDDIQNQNDIITEIFNEYRDLNSLPKYIDDLGMTGNILTTSLASMGHKGNERYATVTQIQATKDIDAKAEMSEKTEYKNKFGKLLNKFR